MHPQFAVLKHLKPGADRRVLQLARGVPSGQRCLWVLGEREGLRATVAFERYMAALDREESPAEVYALLVDGPVSSSQASTIPPNHSDGRRGELAADETSSQTRGLALGLLDRTTLVVVGVAPLGPISAPDPRRQRAHLVEARAP